jgi:hypothetical protein
MKWSMTSKVILHYDYDDNWSECYNTVSFFTSLKSNDEYQYYGDAKFPLIACSVSSNTTFMLLRDFVISFLLYLLTYKVPLNFLLPNNFKFIQPSDLQIIQVVTHAMHFSNKMYELPGNTATEHVINSLDSYFDLRIANS